MDVVGKTLDIIGLANREVILVTQGYVTSQYGNLWALANPNRIEKLVLLNQPLLPTSKIPFILQQYRIPLVAPFVSQDAMRAERFLEGGGPYVMPVSDSERWEPFCDVFLTKRQVLSSKKSLMKYKFGKQLTIAHGTSLPLTSVPSVQIS